MGLLHCLSKESDIKFEAQQFVYDEINNLEKFETEKNDLNLTTKIDRSLSKVSFREEQVPKSHNNLYDLDLTSQSHHELTKDFTISNESFSEAEKRNIKLFKNGFKYAYSQMDKMLSRGRDETSQLRWSGATACTCVIENKINEAGLSEGWIHIANCGDVEAIVIIDNSKSKLKQKKNFRLLTTLHTINENVKDRGKLETTGEHKNNNNNFGANNTNFWIFFKLNQIQLFFYH